MLKICLFLQRVSEDQVFEETDIDGRKEEEESETHQIESDEQEDEEVKQAVCGIVIEEVDMSAENEERKSPADDDEHTSFPEQSYEESNSLLGNKDEKLQNEEDEERKSQADYEERMSNCVAEEEKNSLHDEDNERQSLIEEPQISRDLNVPIGADWDNSFLQDEDDCLDQTRAADDKKPLLDENLVGCLVVSCSRLSITVVVNKALCLCSYL